MFQKMARHSILLSSRNGSCFVWIVDPLKIRSSISHDSCMPIMILPCPCSGSIEIEIEIDPNPDPDPGRKMLKLCTWPIHTGDPPLFCAFQYMMKKNTSRIRAFSVPYWFLSFFWQEVKGLGKCVNRYAFGLQIGVCVEPFWIKFKILHALFGEVSQFRHWVNRIITLVFFPLVILDS